MIQKMMMAKFWNKLISLEGGWLKPYEIYWKAYGGWPAIRSSPYVYLATALTLLLAGLWYPADPAGERKWAPLALAVLPSLISFSLGALAIVFAMTSGAYLRLLHRDGAENSMFMQLVAVFFHFIIVQVLALVLSFALEAYDNIIISAVGFWFFCYALLSGVAAASNLVLVADIKNKAAPLDDDDPDRN